MDGFTAGLQWVLPVAAGVSNPSQLSDNQGFTNETHIEIYNRIWSPYTYHRLRRPQD